MSLVKDMRRLLQGATLIAVRSERPIEEIEREWLVLLFERPDGTRVKMTLSRDDEGNGPGSAFLEVVRNKAISSRRKDG